MASSILIWLVLAVGAHPSQQQTVGPVNSSGAERRAVTTAPTADGITQQTYDFASLADGITQQTANPASLTDENTQQSASLTPISIGIDQKIVRPPSLTDEISQQSALQTTNSSLEHDGMRLRTGNPASPSDKIVHLTKEVTTASLTHRSDILAGFVAAVLEVRNNCAASIVFDEGYAAEADDVARHLSTEERGYSVQFSSVDSYLNDTHHTEAVQAGACRLFLLMLSSTSSLDRLNTVTYLVGRVWDHRGHFLILTPAPPGDAAASASSGVLQNLPFFHVAHPIGSPVHRMALWLYSGFDLSLRYVQGWKPERGAPRLVPPAPNFVGRRLKFVSFEHEPSNIYLDGKLGGEHVGMDYWLARALADVYNFTLDMREPTDGGKWGEALPNGTWIGLVGDVKERRAHFGIANIFLTLSRWKHVDYSRPYDLEHACFVVWNKPPLPHWLAVVRPFSWPAWLSILVSLMFSVAALVLLARRAGGERATFTSVPGAALYNFGVLVARTHSLEPRRAPSRNFDIGWRLATMVLGFAYCAKLISFLTFPTQPAPIDTHRELAQTGVEVGSWGGTLGELMAASTSPWDRQLASRYVPNYDFDNALRRIYAREYGYIENRNTLIYYIQKYYTTKTGEKQLHIMDECFQNFMISVMLPKYSMLTDLFSRSILRVREAGLIPIWFRWSLDAVKKELVDVAKGVQTSSQTRSLALEHLQGVFLLLLLGWVLSLLAFLGEVAAARVRGGQTTARAGAFLVPRPAGEATPPTRPASQLQTSATTDSGLLSI